MSHLWIVEVDSGVGGQVEHPPLGETLRILAGDVDWVLVEADTLGEVERACEGYRWSAKGHPRAGKYTDLGGDVVYIDDDGDKVADAFAVVKTLDVEIDEYTEENADDILANMLRVW